MQSDQSEDEDEFGGEDLVVENPVGEYDGARNVKNERHGRGRALLPGGDVYLGCYYKGLRHGLGIYKYGKGNGARYGGDFVMGVKEGWGTMYFPDGSQYTGNWEKNQRHGWGVLIYPNCDEYEGWWYRGMRNGRGIYRTKKTGEKFVGDWILGKRNGPGMIIREAQKHTFIGTWYNGVPKGEGTFIFDEHCCEQQGRYTHMKISEATEQKWKDNGYQVFLTRADPPPMNPFDVMRLQAEKIMEVHDTRGGEDDGGQGDLTGTGATAAGDPGLVPNPVDLLREYMKQFVAEELAKEENKIRIVPIWHALKVVPLMTSIPDATVPPPPIPPTPMPPPPPPEAELEEEEAEEEEVMAITDPYGAARRAAQTHRLGQVYHGQGVCQDDELVVKINSAEAEPYARFSQLSLTRLDDVTDRLNDCGGQLQPQDMEEVTKQSTMKGLEMAERWRECLNKDPSCVNPNIPPPPGGDGSRPTTQVSTRPVDSAPGGGRASTGYNPDIDTEQTLTGEETDASYTEEDEGNYPDGSA